MIFTIDIGNTTIGLCGLERTADGYRTRFSLHMNTVREKSAQEYRIELNRLLARENIALSDWEGAALSSVVPCLTDRLRSAVKALTGIAPLLVTAQSDTGLTLAVAKPEQVGLDRIADAAWAAAHFPLPVVTVDLGTATTMNVVDEGGVFLGGLIAPGISTGLQALSTRAAQLPQIELSIPTSVIGKSTEECMCAGVVSGTAAMIDGIVARIEQELGKPVSLVLTGGLARYVDSLCRHPHVYDPALLSKGLATIYERCRETT
jgi:type III pantothenate kinase